MTGTKMYETKKKVAKLFTDGFSIPNEEILNLGIEKLVSTKVDFVESSITFEMREDTTVFETEAAITTITSNLGNYILNSAPSVFKGEELEDVRDLVMSGLFIDIMFMGTSIIVKF